MTPSTKPPAFSLTGLRFQCDSSIPRGEIHFRKNFAPNPYAEFQDMIHNWNPGNDPRMAVMPWESAIKRFREIFHHKCLSALLAASSGDIPSALR